VGIDTFESLLTNPGPPLKEASAKDANGSSCSPKLASEASTVDSPPCSEIKCFL
jgi:hypothetical protein